MKTFDDLFEEFFENNKNKSKRKGRPKKKEDEKSKFGDEISNLINTLSNFKQITDKDEQNLIDNDLGEPDKIEFFEEEELFFKRSIWHSDNGEYVKLEVSDLPFEEISTKTLEELLQEALYDENYEKAAKIRDEITKLKK